MGRVVFALLLWSGLLFIAQPVDAQPNQAWAWFDARMAQSTPETVGLQQFRTLLEANTPQDFLQTDLVSRDVLLSVVTRGAANLSLQQLMDLGAAVQALGPNASAGERLTVVLGRLGPGYVKLGQFLGNRPDILRPEHRAALAQLSTRSEPIDPSVVEAHFLARLQAYAERTIRGVAPSGTASASSFDARSLVRRLDPVPLGVGSMGQAHRVELTTGDEFVYKMLKPGAREQIQRDFDGIVEVAATSGNQTFTNLIEAVREQSLREANLNNESEALQLAREDLHWLGVNVPRVVDGMVGEDFMLMELAPGSHDPRQLRPSQRRRMAARVFQTALYLVFFSDQFHGDPHRGNVLFTGTSGLSLIDWGLTGSLTTREKMALVELIGAIVMRSDSLATNALQSLGQPLSARQREVVRRSLAGSGAPLQRAQNMLIDLEATGVRTPTGFIQASKALMLAEGVARELHPEFSAVSAIQSLAPTIGTGAAARFSPFSQGQTSRVLRQLVVRTWRERTRSPQRSGRSLVASGISGVHRLAAATRAAVRERVGVPRIPRAVRAVARLRGPSGR